MQNIDEKAFTLGIVKWVMVIVYTGQKSPRTTPDGTREHITVIKVCRVKQVILPPIVVLEGTVYYKGWYSKVTNEKYAYFAYSPKGLYLVVYIYP